MLQQTLAQKIVFNGFGIHTAKFAEVTLYPQADNTGIVFRSERVSAKYNYQNVRGDARGTQVILEEGLEVLTVEHLVSALVGLGVDNVLIDVDGPEIPIKDGSARFFVELIQKAGLFKQKTPRQYFPITKELRLEEKDKCILVKPADSFILHFATDYAHSLAGPDVFSFDFAKDDFTKELAGARTFGFLKELQPLWSNGKALGATTQNAILISDAGFSTELRYPDELTRHKVIDFIGDIMALGSVPQGEFFVAKSGHSFNRKLVEELLK